MSAGRRERARVTGYAQAGIPLKVPPDIGGLAPGVALRYNSGTVDSMNEHWIADSTGSACDQENARTRLQASPVGLGWALDFGALFRSGTNDPQGNPLFYLVHGNRTYELAYVDGTYFRTKPDDFLQVRKLTGGGNECASHEYWLIEAKDGTQYRYATTRTPSSGPEGGSSALTGCRRPGSCAWTIRSGTVTAGSEGWPRDAAPFPSQPIAVRVARIVEFGQLC